MTSDIIIAMHPFSVYEKRLIVIFFNLYRVKKCKCLKISINEQAKNYNMWASWWYGSSDNIVQGLNKKVYLENHGKISLFEKVEYKKGIFTLSLNQKIEKIISSKEEYTDYNMREFMALSSIHSQYLYGLLSLYATQDRASVVFTIKEFKSRLGVAGKYKTYKAFRKELLEKIEKEIHEKTSLQYKWRGVSTGAGYNRIEFYDIKSRKDMRGIQKVWNAF